MCGRFNLLASPEEVKDNFLLPHIPLFDSSYNIPPGQKILTIVQTEKGNFKSTNLYWGLIPHWSKDRKISNNLINARVETITEKPAFKAAYQQRRCLIPATGFYEWKMLESGKQAYCISHKDRQIFAFAGLWEYWKHGTGMIYSCAIITRTANTLMTPIHHRMPIIIDKQYYCTWLDKKASPTSIQTLLATSAYKDIMITPINNWVNNPQHDDKNCLN